MTISKLIVNNVRNIESLHIEPCAKSNILVGENGSGKTSLLEAIYTLATGSSFRTRNSAKLISYQAPSLSVFGVVNGDFNLGIEKFRNGENRIRINTESKNTAAALAELLPVQIINPSVYHLLDKGPKLRQQFLDWGLFHVEHKFLFVWRRINRAIKHRNMALRRALPQDQVTIWDRELIPHAINIDQLRDQYMQAFVPVFKKILQKLSCFEIDIVYFRGWSDVMDLQAVLKSDFLRDKALGYTQHGPHRADLRIMVNGSLAKDVLSRGEQKVLLCAMKLAQGVLMHELTGKSCVYLMDDLAAELDKNKRQFVAVVLSDIKAQLFMTTVDMDAVMMFADAMETRSFYIKQGCIHADKLVPC